MELIEVAKKMEQAMQALGLEGKRSLELIKAKATAMAEYDKMLGVHVGTLRAEGTPVSVIDKIAKGNVSEFLHKKIVAEEILKAHYSRMEQLKAQLNGLQSINRHLSHN